MSEARKAFEAWAKLAFPHMSLLKKGDTDKYVYKTANFACEAFCEGEAWQASRQALEGEPVAYITERKLEWLKSGPVLSAVVYRKHSEGSIPLYTHPASRQAVSVPDMWRDVDYEVPEQAQEVILVLGEKVVHGRGLGECFGTIIGKWRQQSGCPCPNHQIRRTSNGSNNNFNGL